MYSLLCFCLSIGAGFDFPLSPKYHSMVYSDDVENGGRSVFSTNNESRFSANGTSTTTSTDPEMRRYQYA